MEENFIKKLRESGMIPSDTVFVKEWSDHYLGKNIAFKANIKGVATKLSPPITIEKLEKQDGDIDALEGLHTKFLDYDVEIRQYNLIMNLKGKYTKSQIVEQFNRIFSLFNILGIPFDFVNPSEIFLFINAFDKDIETFFSNKAKIKGINYEPVVLSHKELMDILLVQFGVWESIKKSGLLAYGHIYIFLGYSRYYHFNEQYLLSFLNGWMFIEAIINYFWEKSIEDVFKNTSRENSPLEKERDWTANIKIDELYMLKIIDEELKDKLQDLRKKRNKIFHVDKNEIKMEVNDKDSLKIILVGLEMFYKALGLYQGKKLIDFQEIAKKFYKTIHKQNF